tara:strand:+ start:2912 stop:3262 length:351 start_codon:yes stop_codon:yes gene_type:complete
MSVNNEFKDSIKQWIDYDNKIQELNASLKELRSKRNGVRDNLTVYIEKNQLTNTKFQLSNGYIKYNNTTQYKPITLKLLNECLNNYFNDPTLSKSVCDYVKSQRGKVVVSDIKRYS